jgi:protein-tyrosine phosphatase
MKKPIDCTEYEKLMSIKGDLSDENVLLCDEHLKVCKKHAEEEEKLKEWVRWAILEYGCPELGIPSHEERVKEIMEKIEEIEKEKKQSGML